MKYRLFALLLLLAPLVLLLPTPAASAHAASLHYQRGYSIQGSWLCYGWSNGAYHCTQHHSGFHSLNPSWVPNSGSPAPRAVQQTSFAKSAHDPYPFGQCTYGAFALAHDNVAGLGNADQWLARARARGLPTGSTPRVGATVTYAPGVQGASGLGHVAHVIAVYANGSFLVREMNYYGFGGGFGRWSTRVSHTGWGVGFIY